MILTNFAENFLKDIYSGLRILQILYENFKFINLRTAFYIVTPDETSFLRVEDVPQFTDKTISWFLFLIILEMVIWSCREKTFTSNTHFMLNDTITSLNAGLSSQLLKISGRTVSLVLYSWIYENYRVFDWPINSIYLWFFTFFAQDFLYYLGHRFMHEVGIFWAFHSTHHSSEYYNLTTALRQNIFQDVGLTFFECMQSFVVPPPMFLTHKALNALYQFWIHNEITPNLGPLEYLLNTPSHHRIHHGRNPYCIDKNYGGVFIIWDRIFGTFEPENEEKPIYGLVENVKTFNPFYLQLFEFKNLGWDKLFKVDDRAWEIFPGILNKIKTLFMPPGYLPGYELEWTWFWLKLKNPAEGVPPIEEKVKKYHKPLNLCETLYVIAQFGLANFAYIQFSHSRSTLPWSNFFAYLFFILSTVQSIGFLLDKRWFSSGLELVRLVLITLYCGYVNNSLIFVVEIISIAYVYLLLINKKL